LADRLKASHEQQVQRSLRMICTPSEKASLTGLGRLRFMGLDQFLGSTSLQQQRFDLGLHVRQGERSYNTAKRLRAVQDPH
jgi:hypothetical protein